MNFYNIYNAIDYREPGTRIFAVSAIAREHGGNYNIDQVCDIWDAVHDRWVYVQDPYDFLEYVAPASQSIRAGLRGDCDDHAVVIAACIRAIGGAALIACEMASSGGHAWPLVYVGRDYHQARALAAHISYRYRFQPNSYDIELYEIANLGYWLSLDWTADRPGGPRMIPIDLVVSNFNVPGFDPMLVLLGQPLPSPAAP